MLAPREVIKRLAALISFPPLVFRVWEGGDLPLGRIKFDERIPVRFGAGF